MTAMGRLIDQLASPPVRFPGRFSGRFSGRFPGRFKEFMGYVLAAEGGESGAVGCS